MSTLYQIIALVKKYHAEIALFIGVILISLFSFAMGYITAKQAEKTGIRFENYK